MNAKKKILLLIILLLIFVSGVSYAYYEAVVHGTGNTNMEGSAHTATIEDLILTGTTEVVNTNMIPGESSTYSFTIQNPNAFQVCFGIYFDNVENTFVNTSDLEVSMEGETGIFPLTGDTSTIIGGFRAPANETTTYTITITYKNVEGKNQNGDMGKKFSGTIKARATECGPEISEKTLASLTDLNPNYTFTNSEKCLAVNDSGLILNPNDTMTDADTPIICAMPDDYGTSYYLRGKHEDDNVAFAGSCWKIIRVTGTGGIRLLYNGEVDSSGTCTNRSGTHDGFSGELLNITGSKMYGDSYTKTGNTYTLTNPVSANYTDSSSDALGKYTCNTTSTSCNTLYLVLTYYDDESAYVLKLDQSTNYASIGKSSFNYIGDTTVSYDMDTLSFVGYAWKNFYAIQSLNQRYTATFLNIASLNNSTKYYFGDSLSYNSSDSYYYITNQDGSDVELYSFSDYDADEVIGLYTCKTATRYNSTTIRCKTAYKSIDADGYNTMISEYLSGGRTSVGDIKMASSYSFDGSTYTLTNPVTITPSSWYQNYSNYKNYYMCGNWNTTSCTRLYKAFVPAKYYAYVISSNNNYYYGDSFTYTEGEEKPYTLNNASQVWDMTTDTSKEFLNNHHYTCFNNADNKCENMYYIISMKRNVFYVIVLDENETGTDAINKMVGNDNINATNSEIKASVDWWYKTNLEGTIYESLLEDSVFCNDRTIAQYGGWGEHGILDSENNNSKLLFNYGAEKYYLKCPSKRDAFTVNDTSHGNGALTYPIGLLNNTELILNGNISSRITSDIYWISGADFASNLGTYNRAIKADGQYSNFGANASNGVRPVITLKSGTKFRSDTDGTQANPFKIE